MQEIRNDGSEVLMEIAKGISETEYNYKSRMVDMLRSAIEDGENRSVAVHKPGAVFKSKGQWYRVDPKKGLQRISWMTAMKKRRRP